MYKVVMLKTASRQLHDAALYIASELCAPEAATHLLDETARVVAMLKEMPYRYPLCTVTGNMHHEVRFIPVKNYMLYYYVNEGQQTVYIWRFLYYRRNMKRG